MLRWPGLALLLWTSLADASATSQAILHAQPELSTDGVVQLRWQTDDAAVEVQRDATPAFANPLLVYQGGDSASLLSGLDNGDHFFRLRIVTQGPAAWTVPVKVTVEHHAIARAWSIFSLGAVVFVSTLVLILSGNRRDARGEA